MSAIKVHALVGLDREIPYVAFACDVHVPAWESLGFRLAHCVDAQLASVAPEQGCILCAGKDPALRVWPCVLAIEEIPRFLELHKGEMMCLLN